MDKEQWNDNCFAPSFSAYNLEKIIHLGFALTKKQWHFEKEIYIFPLQKVKKNPVPMGGEREKNEKERREEEKKNRKCVQVWISEG